MQPAVRDQFPLPRLDPALDRYRRLAADAQPCVAETLHSTFDTIVASWGDRRWRASTLTGRGTPVEVAFTSADRSQRFTAEAGRPDTPPVARLHGALGLFTGLADCRPPDRLINRLSRWQTGTPTALRYGAWLSGRFEKDRPPRFKVYAEVPPGDANPSAWQTALLGPSSLAPVHRASLAMVGWESITRRLELYFEAHDLRASALVPLLARVGLGDRVSALVEALGRLASRPVNDALLTGKWGFSYARSCTGRPVAFTLYTFASTLFSGDTNVRRAILARSRAEGFDVSQYERLSHPLDRRHAGDGHHGMLGVTVAADGPPVYAWGLAPPAATTKLHRATEARPDGGARRRLLASQTDSGAFPSTVTVDGITHEDANAFTTALVVDALDALPATPSIERATARALDFLERCGSTSHPGAYHFYPPGREPAWMGKALTPDVDDTALALLVLCRHGRVGRAAALRAVEVMDPFRLHWRPESTPAWVGPGAYRTWLLDGPGANPVDACVNLNLMTLLCALEHTGHSGFEAARTTVLRGLRLAGGSRSAIDRLTPYYPHPAELVLALERAHAIGVPGLEQAAETLRNLIAAAEAPYRPFDPDRPIYRSPDGCFSWASPVLQAARELHSRSSIHTTPAHRRRTPKGQAS